MNLNCILDRQGWLLADGATATNLFNMGLEAGEAPEMLNVMDPAKVSKLYRNAVAAGAQLFLTNSFGSNRARLQLHNAADRSRELSKVAALLAREVADSSPELCIVAGSMGPSGEIMGPAGSLSHSDAVELFHEQATGLAEGGVDLLWIETMSSQEEFLAAAEGCRLAGLPWCGTMSFDTAGRTMMGISPPQLVDIAESVVPAPLAMGANCGSGISDLMQALIQICDARPSRPVIAKGNAGIPSFVEGRIHYAGSPEVMADYVELARNVGATIIGGCCGTTPRHVEKMRERLETAPMGAKPRLEEVIAKLGPLTYDNAPRTNRRRSRRRRSAGRRPARHN